MTSTAAKIASAQLGVGDTSIEVTDWFRRQLLAALADPMFNTPKAFETWIVDRVAVSGLNLSIGQIVGFSQFAAQPATTIYTNETTTSTSFTDLATTGPTLTGLPDGQYLFLWGAVAYVSAGAGASASMAIRVNATEADNNDAIENASSSPISISGFATKTLSDINNTVTARYRVANAAGTIGFYRRTLIAFKYANT